MGGQIFDESQAKRRTMWSFNPNDPVIIGVDTKDGPEHELYDERAFLPLVEETVVNFMAVGVLEPIVVRRSPKGKAEVVDGRRRVLHAREANRRLKKLGEPLLKLMAVAKDGDEVFYQKIAIALNELRESDAVMTKVEKCARLLARNGGDLKEAQIAFGVTKQAINQWMKIHGLAKKVKNAIARGEIAPTAAAQLSELTREEQVEQLNKLLAGGAGATKKNGKKKRPTASSVKRATGRKTSIGKRILLKVINDEKLSEDMPADMMLGIKVALGEHVPERASKFGKILEKAGYRYE